MAYNVIGLWRKRSSHHRQRRRAKLNDLSGDFPISGGTGRTRGTRRGGGAAQRLRRQRHQPFGGKADHLAQKAGVRALFQELTQCRHGGHLGRHRCGDTTWRVWDGKPLPRAEIRPERDHPQHQVLQTISQCSSVTHSAKPAR